MQNLYKIGYASVLVPANDISDCQCGTFWDGTLYVDENGRVVEGGDWGSQWTECNSDWHEKSAEERNRIAKINELFGTSGFRY